MFTFFHKGQSHLSLFCAFLRAKCSHFNRNSHDWEFSMSAKDFPHRFCNGSCWSRRFAKLTNRKLFGLKVPTVRTVLHTSLHYWRQTMELFWQQNFTEISLMWLHRNEYYLFIRELTNLNHAFLNQKKLWL